VQGVGSATGLATATNEHAGVVSPVLILHSLPAQQPLPK